MDKTDLDFASSTINCIQIPADKLLKNGFNTGHGSVRPPKTIGAAATLICIILQSSQNDFFGGQSIPMLDYYLAPFVAKSFVRNCATFLEANSPVELHWGLRDADFDPALIKKRFTKVLDRYIDENTHVMNDAGEQAIEAALAELFAEHGVSEHVPEFSVIAESIPCIMDRMLPFARRRTERDTFQAMEATVHNLCTLSSRAGGQVPFSSVNLGTDISEEGRMVTRNLFLATEAGLGSGETAVFPISVMKMKKGVTDKGSPNYDLFQLACRVSSKRLFPKQHWGLCVA